MAFGASDAILRTMSWNCSLRATKSVSELTSTTAPPCLRGDADQALGGDAAGLLGGLRQALLAQPVDGLLDVALGLGQRGLAVHHAGAGLVAQLLHHGCGDGGHGCKPHSAWRARHGTPRVDCEALSCAAMRPALLRQPSPRSASWLAATQFVARDAALQPAACSSAAMLLGVEIGDLPEVIDAGIVEALLELRR